MENFKDFSSLDKYERDLKFTEELSEAKIIPAEVSGCLLETIGKLGHWTFVRKNNYWEAKVLKVSFGIPLSLACELHYKEFPIKQTFEERDLVFGKFIRSGGNTDALPPFIFGAKYDPEDKDNQKAFENFLSENSKKCLLCELTVGRYRLFKTVKWYITDYHIDNQIALNEFVDFLKKKNII